jgi:hypothetical protein
MDWQTFSAMTIHQVPLRLVLHHHLLMKPIAIDLGLSVRWADRNVGAEELCQYGKLFRASGKFKEKREEVAYLDALIKSELGEKWRLPTFKEIQELQEKCSFVPAIYNINRGNSKIDRTRGIKIKGPNGRYFFILETIYPINVDYYNGLQGPAFWSLINNRSTINIPYNNLIQHTFCDFQNLRYFEDDNIPYGYYYNSTSAGIPIRPVTSQEPTGRDKFLRMLEYPLSQDSYFDTNENAQAIIVVHQPRYEFSPEEKRKRYEAREEHRRRIQEREQEEENQKKANAEQERIKRYAEIRRNRPRNKYDTGSVVAKTRMPGTTAIVGEGWIDLANGHRYSIKHNINAWYGDDQGWSCRREASKYYWSEWSDTYQGLVQKIEQYDFEWSLNFYDLHGRLPELQDD